MSSTLEPLPLSVEEKANITKYLQTYKSFAELAFDPGDYHDAFKLTECLCHIHRLKDELKKKKENTHNLKKRMAYNMSSINWVHMFVLFTVHSAY
jgi:hypothetical protein